MSRIQVAVVIVSYKSAALAIDCMRSISRERAVDGDGLDIRCYVIDNASGDGPAIAAAIDSDGWQDWTELIVAPRNGGFAYGCNLGVSCALRRGNPQFVHFLNPDTVLKPGAIHQLVGFLQAHPRAGLAGGAFENGDGSPWKIAFRFPSLWSEMFGGLALGPLNRLVEPVRVAMQMGEEPREADWLAGASMMVKREVLREIGGMDEDFFLYFEETEFCFRARAAGWSVWYVPESLVVHIAGQSTKVTERDAGPRRMPGYWFESRRRYFARTRGIGYAIATDCGAIVGGSVRALLDKLRGRSHEAVPHYLGDLLAHSLAWSSDARAAQQRHAIPAFD